MAMHTPTSASVCMRSTSARRDDGHVPQSSTHAGCHGEKKQGTSTVTGYQHGHRVPARSQGTSTSTSTSTRGAPVAHATHAAFCADLLNRCSRPGKPGAPSARTTQRHGQLHPHAGIAPGVEQGVERAQIGPEVHNLWRKCGSYTAATSWERGGLAKMERSRARSTRARSWDAGRRGDWETTRRGDDETGRWSAHANSNRKRNCDVPSLSSNGTCTSVRRWLVGRLVGRLCCWNKAGKGSR